MRSIRRFQFNYNFLSLEPVIIDPHSPLSAVCSGAGNQNWIYSRHWECTRCISLHKYAPVCLFVIWTYITANRQLWYCTLADSHRSNMKIALSLLVAACLLVSPVVFYYRYRVIKTKGYLTTLHTMLYNMKSWLVLFFSRFIDYSNYKLFQMFNYIFKEDKVLTSN